MNLHPKDVKSVLLAYVDGVLDGHPKAEFNQLRITNHEKGRLAMLKKLSGSEHLPGLYRGQGPLLRPRP